MLIEKIYASNSALIGSDTPLWDNQHFCYYSTHILPFFRTVHLTTIYRASPSPQSLSSLLEEIDCSIPDFLRKKKKWQKIQAIANEPKP